MRAIICLLAALGVSVHADLELTYFAAKGRAEPLRLMLHFANIPFTDTRIQWSQWLSIKNDTTSEWVCGEKEPGLMLGPEIATAPEPARGSGSERLRLRAGSQSRSRKFWGRLRLPSPKSGPGFSALRKFICDLNDFPCQQKSLNISAVAKRFQSHFQAANYTTTFLPTAQRFIPLIDGKLQGSQSGLFSPLGLSYVDFFWAGLIDWINDVHPEIVQQFPRSVALKNEVYSLPQLQSYLATRDSLNAPTANTGLNIG
uniref:GST_C domain-containing protein n=1 Tax=Bursaphelenchus xylophilus TaxID=6326 RepID=A0A1I7RQJ6_BURXY